MPIFQVDYKEGYKGRKGRTSWGRYWMHYGEVEAADYSEANRIVKDALKSRYELVKTKMVQKNPISSLNDWLPCHAIRMTPQGIQVLREKNPSRGSRCKNIEMGFRDQRGIFHPIRKSSDYDEEEVGERLDTGRRRKVRSRKKATKKKKSIGKRKRK